MPKWVKMLVAILLLPACLGAVKTLGRVITATSHSHLIWVAAATGAACWVVIYLLLPKPMLIYVFGHELTHALSAWLCGGRVKKFKATGKGGHVVVSKSNFFITLAPYFFPLYVVLVVGIYALGHLIWGWTDYRVWFHFLLGMAYAFHVTLTAQVLKTRQPDIIQEGYFFSGVIIFLGNVGVLLVGLPLLTAQMEVLRVLGWWCVFTGEVWQRLSRIF